MDAHLSWRSSCNEQDDRLSEASDLTDLSETTERMSQNKLFNSCPARLSNRNSLKRHARVYEQLQAADAGRADSSSEGDGLPIGSWPRVRRRHSPAVSVFDLNAAFQEQARQSGSDAGASHEHGLSSQDETVRLGADLSRIHLPRDDLSPAAAYPLQESERTRVTPTTIPEDSSVVWPEPLDEQETHASPAQVPTSDGELASACAQLDALVSAQGEEPLSFDPNDPFGAIACSELLELIGAPQQQEDAPDQSPQLMSYQQQQYGGQPYARQSYQQPVYGTQPFAQQPLQQQPPQQQPLQQQHAHQHAPMYGGVHTGELMSIRKAEPGYENVLSPVAGEMAMAKAMRMRNALERKEWSNEEDELIINGVMQYGYRWRQIAAQLPGRSDDAVRNRWNRLKDAANIGTNEGGAGENTPKRKSGNPAAGRLSAGSEVSDETRRVERIGWTQLEDSMIVSLVQERGHRWSQIAKRLPGRTEHAIRNRWHRLQKMAEDGAMRQNPLQASFQQVQVAPVRTA